MSPRGEAVDIQGARDRLARFAWPGPLVAALDRLAAGGHHAWLVGGTVRDVLLGRAPGGAFDVATDLAPERVIERFLRVEPIGLVHGTVLVLEDGLEIECTTFRREAAYRDARHPDSVEFTRDVNEDLARRDLTVNAMAFDPRSGEWRDPYRGFADLEAGVLRAVGDPLARFREDGLRPLRVARFTATLEMEAEPETRAALAGARDRSALVAPERVRGELERMLGAREPSRGFNVLHEAGLLDLWLPELEAAFGVPQNRFHAYDVYTHSLRTCDAAPADKRRVRWAALLHDLGKPATRVVRDGDGTFYGHENVGAELADARLAALRLPNDERNAIVHLVRHHMFDYRSTWSDAALRRWLRRVTLDAVADLFDLRLADVVGNGTRFGFPHQLEEMRMRIEALLAADHALSVADLAIDGGDVMRFLRIGPGPRVGEALSALLEDVLDHPEWNERATLLERLAERRANAPEAPPTP